MNRESAYFLVLGMLGALTFALFVLSLLVGPAAIGLGDSVAALLTDRLDYAAELVEQARAQWEKHCAGEVNAAAAVSFLDSRLRPAFESLNLVRSSMSERATSTALNQ